MPSQMWKGLGLTRDEWLDCRRSALELSLAGPARVTARQVAVEFALARAFDEPAAAPGALRDAAPARARPSASRVSRT